MNTTLHKTGKRKTRSDKVGRVYNCEKCEYKSLNKYNYLTHQLNNHESKEKRKLEFKFYCEACDFGVFTKSSYDKHLKTKTHKRRMI